MFRLPAPAKLNLCLKILGRQPNGYHQLQTAFQLLDLVDELQFESAADIEVLAPGNIPMDENLVTRAARLLAASAGKSAGAKITLTKRIPMGAGLGGGSSDAATTLLGLNHLWQLGRTTAELAVLGRELGADVPVFIHGHSAWGEGIGEDLTPIELPQKTFLVIRPNCHISTAEIFAHSDLTRDSSAITIARFLSQGAGNDCEPVVRKLYPEVDEALLWLNKWGAARMTGTGSCVFLDLEQRANAEEIQSQLPDHWQAFIADGINESPVRQALLAL